MTASPNPAPAPTQAIAATRTAAQLVVSPLNARINLEDANATAAFERSIAKIGLIEPLILHPLTRAQAKRIGAPKATDAALGGGRRLRAITRLVAGGTLPADWPIPCMVHDLDMDADVAAITELSLAENMRRDLRSYEVHAGVVRALDDGASEDEIAEVLGWTIQSVRQSRRLGHLDPEVFAAFAEARIDLERAKAFAATEDQALQRAAFAHFGGPARAYTSSPAEIRRYLRVGDHELAELLLFVGEATYRAAGGRYELDLFHEGPDQRGIITDEGTLRELAEKRLEDLREDLRGELELPNLRFAATRPDTGLWFEHVDGAPVPEGVVAYFAIQRGGSADLSWYWDSKAARRRHEEVSARAGTPAARAAAPRGAGDPARIRDDSGFDANTNFTAAQAARAAVKDEHGLTADGLHVMRSLRRLILRAALGHAALHGLNPHIGRDYLVWSQLRSEFGNDREVHTGARRLGGTNFGSDDTEPRDVTAPFLAEAPANDWWQTLKNTLAAEPFMAERDPAASLRLFVALGDDAKMLWAAVLAGETLLRSANVDGWRIPAHDALAELLDIAPSTVRQGWTPTRRFMGLFSKLRRIAAVAPFVERAALSAWASKKDAIIAEAAAAVLDPATHTDPAVAKAAAEWVPTLLRFATPAFAGETTLAKRELEPAE